MGKKVDLKKVAEVMNDFVQDPHMSFASGRESFVQVIEHEKGELFYVYLKFSKESPDKHLAKMTPYLGDD